jgi:hypothetical protein
MGHYGTLDREAMRLVPTAEVEENRKRCPADPWFCLSGSCCSPQFGALSCPASHCAEADFIGPPATTSFCTALHLGHSNRRCSKPIGLGLMLASIMRIVQCEQRGRSMDLSDGPEENLACGIALLCIGAGACSTLRTDNCRRRHGNEKGYASQFSSPWSILLTLSKFHELRPGSTGEDFQPSGRGRSSLNYVPPEGRIKPAILPQSN